MITSEEEAEALLFRSARTGSDTTTRRSGLVVRAAATMRHAGMTLVEVMLVVAILAVLVSIGYPSYQGYLDRAKVAEAKADILEIETAITRYSIENNAFPDDLSDIGMGNFLDPWGNPYQYLNIATTKGNGKVRKDHALVPINSDYDLYSMGKDGKSVSPLTAKLSRDDVVRGRNGQFVGLASDF